ncbi:MAG TPA: low specificity L-threonine aldolase [Phycisphaerae bacterium]|nr:low specificity L-threonine aldolase [Phycisphaerae bacterium]
MSVLATTQQLTSDNQSAICPEAWSGLVAANADSHCPSYGNDSWTAQAADLLRETFEAKECEVFFCFTGTASNALTIAHLCQSYNSVICHEGAHVETDECGAPEFFANGAKLLLAGGANGKLTPAGVKAVIERRTDIHYPRARVLSLTQATELGTVYTPEEIQRLTEVARAGGLRVHMDGARFANAIATLGVKPAEITWKVGIDALCFGGTKNGLPMGEAILFFNRELAKEFEYRCKQSGQLASKMRFLTAPWVRMLESGAWLRHAQHANRMAQRLATRLREIPNVEFVAPVEANSVFVRMPAPWIAALRENQWTFYTFIGASARLMTSWDSTPGDIDRFCDDLERIARSSIS